MNVEPILCRHGKVIAYKVDGATRDDPAPGVEWCDECEAEWEARR